MPQGVLQPNRHIIEAAFAIRGDSIPVDHGYALYAALSRQPIAGPWLHEAGDVAIHSIRGLFVGNSLLKLGDKSRLRLRLPAAALPQILPLAGKVLDIDGHQLRIGIPQTTLLHPAAALYAHAVTTRNGQDEDRFDAEIRHQLDGLRIRGKATRGKRRVLRIRDKIVVAHSMLVTELTAQESIDLQEAGLGGRRKMGCGVFNPWRG
ncbi:type I-MYXAN CRISPR-associated protein Cas6/Cmx6 [Thiocapsa roseopersicina]|uniref:CRISPR-associated protein Cas6, subtype MYXAN n=1 Tax=Thiocapsa roseopersicina TaxID=1058 RepID=A0A1H2W393_THIRO|nr:type I-MYXAN CRISPR-associated protein Cas6/Cmx6 [Thiocapsa roseopersicina]SDW74956.1 CRISPR-associated protein Cas6, subtype MYXAN [Thiocapsa roseopersicina]